MDHPFQNMIPRREFLRGAAIAAGSAALSGSLVGKALGTERAFAKLYFWNGQNFVLAENLASGDSTLERVRILIAGYGDGGPIRSVAAQFYVPDVNSERAFPFRAWSSGGSTARFEMPVHRGKGVELIASGDSASEKSPLVLSTGNRKGAKLREGTYAIIPAQNTLSGFELGNEDPIAGLVGPDGFGPGFSHILLTIERA